MVFCAKEPFNIDGCDRQSSQVCLRSPIAASLAHKRSAKLGSRSDVVGKYKPPGFISGCSPPYLAIQTYQFSDMELGV